MDTSQNNSPSLKDLSDRLSEAHTRVQAQTTELNPVISLRQGMRTAGIPADALTVDCLRSRRRILLVLHDNLPQQVTWQFTLIDDDPGATFQQDSLDRLTTEVLQRWMMDYLSGKDDNPGI